MIEATVCFLLDESPPGRILLGLKKRGFGEGKFNGLGGKVRDSETPLKTIIREVEEESGLTIVADSLRPMGSIDFFFPFRREFDHHVHIFVATSWAGELQESEEMAPTWFTIDEIPHAQMWADDVHWLPLVIAGRRIEAEFTFAEDNETVTGFCISEF